MIARAEALVALPETFCDIDAAPLLCAGLTTFNALATAARCREI